MPKESKTSLHGSPKDIEERRIEVRTLARVCGLSGAQIAAKTGYSRSFVYQQLADMKRGKSTQDRPRSGRPKKISEGGAKADRKKCAKASPENPPGRLPPSWRAKT